MRKFERCSRAGSGSVNGWQRSLRTDVYLKVLCLIALGCGLAAVGRFDGRVVVVALLMIAVSVDAGYRKMGSEAKATTGRRAVRGVGYGILFFLGILLALVATGTALPWAVLVSVLEAASCGVLLGAL